MRYPSLLLAFAILVASPAAAQTVRGVVVEEGSGLPVDGAMVILFDATGEPLRRFLTDGLGRFSMDVEAPGVHVLRVDRIGYASVSTGSFDVVPGGVERTIEVSVQAIELSGLEVESSRRCEVRPEEGQLTARLWSEARKALEATAWTLNTGVYRYTLMQFTRELDANGHRVLDEDRSFHRGRSQAPYISLPSEDLVEQGFVHTLEDGRQSYYAPDAEVLLSDEFLDTHCMRVTDGEDGLIGLHLEPISGRRLPDIEGTLWLDATTGHLERLEFRYVNLRGSPRVNGELGGEVVFGGLPNGTWVVREWWIRMPKIGQRGPGGPLFRMGYTDQGGVVWRAIDREGTLVFEAMTATVVGILTDPTGMDAVEGAVVSTAAGDTAVTAEDGSFLLSGLPEGLHELAVRHESLDTLGLMAPPVPVRAGLGEVSRTRVTLPEPEELVLQACGGLPRPPGTGIVFGRLLDPEGIPAGRRFLQVTPMPENPADYMLPHRAAPEDTRYLPLSWRSGMVGGQTVLSSETDGRGVFLLCDLPVPAQLRIRTWGPGVPESVWTLNLLGHDALTLHTLVEEGGSP